MHCVPAWTRRTRSSSRQEPPEPQQQQLPQAGAEPKPEKAREPPEAATRLEPPQERAPRLDWAGRLRSSFALDVFACGRWGGRRRVLAYLTAPGGVRAILEHLGLPWLPGRLAPARGPPQNSWF
jgi:hypothetical protein